MTANKSPSDHLKVFFETFATNASKCHPSYPSVLRNVRTSVVLDTSDRPLFVSEKCFNEFGPTVPTEEVPSESAFYQDYLAELESLANAERTRFSQREDSNRRPHIFYRVVDPGFSVELITNAGTKLGTTSSSTVQPSKSTRTNEKLNFAARDSQMGKLEEPKPASTRSTSLIISIVAFISAIIIFLGNLGGARDFVCSIKSLKSDCQQIFDLGAD